MAIYGILGFCFLYILFFVYTKKGFLYIHMGTSSFKLRAIPQKYGKIMKFMIIGAAVEFPGAVFPMPMEF